MAVPKRKTSKSKSRKRRTHQTLSVTGTMNCPECGEAKLPHNICPSCNKYKGEVIVPLKSKE